MASLPRLSLKSSSVLMPCAGTLFAKFFFTTWKPWVRISCA